MVDEQQQQQPPQQYPHQPQQWQQLPQAPQYPPWHQPQHQQMPPAYGQVPLVQQQAPAPADAPHCTMTAGTLRVMGFQTCQFCGATVDRHPEFSDAIAPKNPPQQASYGYPQGFTQQNVPYGFPQQPPPPPSGPQWGANHSQVAPVVVAHQPPPQAVAAANRAPAEPQKKGGMNKKEILAVLLAAFLTFIIWVHFLFIIPYCEANKGEAPDYHIPEPCNGYYGERNVGSADESFKYNLTFVIVIIASVIGLWLQSASAPTRHYLANVLPEGIEGYVRRLVAAPPRIKWKIQCSHSDTDGNGNRTSRITHEAEAFFMIDQWCDRSGAAVGEITAPVRRLRLEKDFRFADAHTKALYDAEFAAFVKANDRDRDKTVWQELLIDDYKDFALAYPLDQKPCGLHWALYAFLSFLTLSLPYRAYFYSQTTPVDFKLIKEVRRL